MKLFCSEFTEVAIDLNTEVLVRRRNRHKRTDKRTAFCQANQQLAGHWFITAQSGVEEAPSSTAGCSC
jgi:hypothetical protein